MGDDASRERQASLAAMSSDVDMSPKARSRMLGVPKVTKIPSFRRSSSSKMSKRRDVPSDDLSSPRKMGATFQLEDEETKTASSSGLPPGPPQPGPSRPPLRQTSPVEKSLEDHPENSFWEESLNDGARSTDGFFDGQPTINNRHRMYSEEEEYPKNLPRVDQPERASVLGPLGFFCACAADEEGDREIARSQSPCTAPPKGD